MKHFPVLVVLLAAGCASQPPPAAGSGASASGGTASTPHLREERATATLDRLAAKDFAGAREWFDGPMRDQISAEAIRHTWTQAEENLGPYQSRTFNGAGRVQGLVRLEYDLVFARGHMRAHVTFDDDGSLAGLWIGPPGQ
jgi:Protein of unknown function (DUF3887)